MKLVLLVGSFRSVVPEGVDDPIGSQGGFVDTLAPAPYSLANAYLKAFVDSDPELRSRYEVRLLDLAEPLELEDEREELELSEADMERIVGPKPHILGFSTYCWNLDTILESSEAIRRRLPNVRIVLGGRLDAADAHELLARYPAIDAIVVGEGEIPFREILRQDGFGGIGGVYARERGEIRCGGPPRSVQVLDEIPSPWLAGLLSPLKNAVMMELSRGCLHACGYCSWNSDKKLRYFSEGRIEQELRWVVKHGHEHVTLNDSAINYDTGRLEAFVRAAHAADPSGKVKYTYNLRHDCLNDEQLRVLRELPTHMVLLGVETLTARGMSQVDRVNVDVTALHARLHALAHAVRPPVASIVLGLPEDDEAGFLETLDQLMRWTEPAADGVPAVGTVLVSLLQIYRGSKLWHRRRELGLTFEERGIPYLHQAPSWPAASLARCKLELVRRIRENPERLKAAEALALMQSRGGVPIWLSQRVLSIVLRDWPEGVEHDGWRLDRVGWMRDTGQGALLRFVWKEGGRARARITLDELSIRASRAGRYRVQLHPLPGLKAPPGALARLEKLVQAVVRGGEHRAATYLRVGPRR